MLDPTACDVKREYGHGDAVLLGDQTGLAVGNIAFEKHFGHVFLICASGLSGQEMLNQLRTRLKNDPQTERAVVRQELLKITQLRLAKLLSP